MASSAAESEHTTQERVVMSVIRVPITFDRANSVADVAMRDVRNVLRGDAADRAFIWNAPVQPSMLVGSETLDLPTLARRVSPTVPPDVTVAMLGGWLQKAGFSRTADGATYCRPVCGPGDVSYFVVLTCGDAAHEMALDVLEQVLANNNVDSFQTVLDRMPPPPIDALFLPDVARGLRARECDRQTLLSLALQHVALAQPTNIEPVEQLRDLGLDPDAPANQTLVCTLRGSSVLGVREMARKHIIATHAADSYCRSVLLGDDVQNCAGDYGERQENAGANGEARYTLRVRSSTDLVRRFDSERSRREQLAEIDAMALFGIGANEAEENLVLFHGTTIEHATSIVNEGLLDHQSADFGEAIYVTPDLAFALETAFELSGGCTSSPRHLNRDPAVVAFVVPRARLDSIAPTLDLRGPENAESWREVTAASLRATTLAEPLLGELEDARLVIGPIVGNGRAVSANRARPVALQETQFAFKQTRQLKQIGRADGRIVVLRVILRDVGA